MTSATKPGSRATIIVTARDRFSLAIRSLNEIIKVTEKPYDLIYVDAGSPKVIASKIREICTQNGFSYLRFDHILSPCQARNIANQRATTPYVAFVENDVMVSRGWLKALVACADETGAEVVQPLICQGTPLHTEIHQAGGNFTDDMDAFFNGPDDKRRLASRHLCHQGETVDQVDLERSEIQVTEFHCFMVRRDALKKLGNFDENMPASKEHVDFSVLVWSKGGRIMLEPGAVVTLCAHGEAFPPEPSDLALFLLCWSPKWQRQSLNHLQRKWGLENDPYFGNSLKRPNWRYREGIARPLIRRIPVIGQSYKVQQIGSTLLMPFLNFAGARLADRQARVARTQDGSSIVRRTAPSSGAPMQTGNRAAR